MLGRDDDRMKSVDLFERGLPALDGVAIVPSNDDYLDVLGWFKPLRQPFGNFLIHNHKGYVMAR